MSLIEWPLAAHIAQQFVGRPIGERHRRMLGGVMRRVELVVVDDEAAADRVVAVRPASSRRRRRTPRTACRSGGRAASSSACMHDVGGRRRTRLRARRASCSVPVGRDGRRAAPESRRGRSSCGSCAGEARARTAETVPWPTPVARQRAVEVRCARVRDGGEAVDRRPAVPANVRAARIGPTVCELDGPMPMRNSSNTLIVIARPDACSILPDLAAVLPEWRPCPCDRSAGTSRAAPTRTARPCGSATSTWLPRRRGAARPTAQVRAADRRRLDVRRDGVARRRPSSRPGSTTARPPRCWTRPRTSSTQVGPQVLAEVQAEQARDGASSPAGSASSAAASAEPPCRSTGRAWGLALPA